MSKACSALVTIFMRSVGRSLDPTCGRTDTCVSFASIFDHDCCGKKEAGDKVDDRFGVSARLVE
jgi:hypothetical protein